MNAIISHLPIARTRYLDRLECAIKYNESKYIETQDERYKGYLKSLYLLKEKIK